jgi:CHAT domain-containing protein
MAEGIELNDMFAVVNPEPSVRAPLPWAEDGMSIIAHRFIQPWGTGYFGPSMEKGSNAKRSLVLQSLGGTYWPIVHFSCHASTDWDDSNESAIYLAGEEKLRVREIFRVERSTARLVFLAACETGIPSQSIPDESSTLPATFLGVGFAGAVASLWAVEDTSTTLLSIRFYEEWIDKGSEPAVALHIAQKWIRSSSRSQGWSSDIRYCRIFI